MKTSQAKYKGYPEFESFFGLGISAKNRIFARRGTENVNLMEAQELLQDIVFVILYG